MNDECQCPSCEKQRNFERLNSCKEKVPQAPATPQREGIGEQMMRGLQEATEPHYKKISGDIPNPTRGAEQVAREIAEKTFGHPVGMSSKPFYELKDSISAAIDEAVGEYRKALESIANSNCCGGCQEAKLVALAVLNKENDNA